MAVMAKFLFSLILTGMLRWTVRAAVTPENVRDTTLDADLLRLLGEWYDVGRTTHIWGPDTWTSHQWTFVRGEDGTVVALHNAMCRKCGGCTDTLVFRVRQRPYPGGGLVLEGNDATFWASIQEQLTQRVTSRLKYPLVALHLTADLGTEMVVSLCFSPPTQGAFSAGDCPRAARQVSVWSRTRSVADWQQWLRVKGQVPSDYENLDPKTGEKCPKLFIDPKLVQEDLVTGSGTPLHSLVGFDNLGTAVLLPCSLVEQSAPPSNGSKMTWYREQADVTVATDGRLQAEEEEEEEGEEGKRSRWRVLTSSPGRMDLLIKGFSPDDTDVYTCVLEERDGTRKILKRLAVSSADFLASPTVVYKSSNVTSCKGETASLECYVNGNPPPVITWWKKDSVRTEAYVQLEGQGPVLRLEAVDEEMEGVYKCEASNDVMPPVQALTRLDVAFRPETEVESELVTVPLEGRAALTCRVLIKSPDVMTWLLNDVSVKRDFRRSVSVIMTSEYHYELKLLIRRTAVEDYGRYACYARDGRHGSSNATVTLAELVKTGEECNIDRIPVMPNFKIQKLLGDTERLMTTRWDDDTFLSQVQGFFLSLSGSLVMYSRGYSPERRQCLEPVATSVTKLDTPGDYLMPIMGHKSRFKVVYTDYTHAVTYLCRHAHNASAPCPPSQRLVQIVSRVPRVADHVLNILYRHVQSTCVPVTSLAKTVPGICKVPADFMYSKGWMGPYPVPSCQVANLPMEAEVTLDHATGPWRLVGEVREEGLVAPQREVMHVVLSRGKMALFFRSSRRRQCSAVEVNRLHRSLTAGSYYFDYNGIAVDTKLLYVAEEALVIYTCLALRHDGTCYPGSQHVELFHRRGDVSEYALLWMTRAVANACVDISRIRMLASLSNCTVPPHTLQAVDARLLQSDNVKIGCHQKIIPSAENFTMNELSGHWIVTSMNAGSLTRKDSSTLANFSKTYHILARPKKRLVVLKRQYERTWDKCTPTKSLELKQNGAPGNFVHKHGDHKVVLKVLWHSGDRALIYWCEEVDDDGVCLPSGLKVEQLQRAGVERGQRLGGSGSDVTTEEELMSQLLQIVTDVCQDPEEFLQLESAEDKCPIPPEITKLAEERRLKSDFDIPVLSCNNELVSGAEKIHIEKLTGEWSVVWRNDPTTDGPMAGGESSYIVLIATGLIYLSRSYSNDLERCEPEMAAKFSTTSGSGDYYSDYGGQQVALKILKTDYHHMLTLRCHLDQASRCRQGRTTVEILSRNKTVDNATRDSLLSVFNASCLGDTQWISFLPDVCRVQNDVLSVAYTEGLDQDYSRIGCRVDLLNSQSGVADDMIEGSWVSVYQSQALAGSGDTARVAFHLAKTPAGSFSLLYRLHSRELHSCQPAQMMELFRDTAKPGTVFQLRHCNSLRPYGFVYVIYADGDHLALLLCYPKVQGQVQWLCDPDLSTQLFVLLVRQRAARSLPVLGDTAALPVNLTLLEKVRGLAADSCVQYQNLVQPNLDPCPIPQDLVTDVAIGSVEACTEHADVQCFPRYIPVHDIFEINDLMDTWYTIADISDGPQPDFADSPLGMTTFHFVAGDDNSLLMLYASTGSGGITQLRQLQKEDSSYYTFDFNDTKALMKIVYMDDPVIVMYWCLQAGNGRRWCSRENSRVTVLSWKPVSLVNKEEIRETLGGVLPDLCVSAANWSFVHTDHFELPEAIVAAIRNGEFEVSAQFVPIQCAKSFVSPMHGFDMAMFQGLWHTVRQTKYRWGNNTWQSTVRSFHVLKDNSSVMAYTGQPATGDHCNPLEVKTLQPASQAGQWTYLEGASTVTVKVLWTDFNSSALLYICAGSLGRDGLCSESALQVEFLSRTPALSPEAERHLAGRLPQVCVPETDVEPIISGLCQIMTELDLLLGSETNGAAVTPCRMQDLPLASYFSISQMKGVWYEIARTRFTFFNTMESIISTYTYEPANNTLEGLFVGTINDQCQTPLKSQTRPKEAEGNSSVIEARIQSGENIFPWFTFRILYFTGDVMLHIACYLENQDGTCPRDKTEVTLLGRSRHLTDEVKASLDGLMSRVCLTTDDLVLTKETANCMPMLISSEEKQPAANLPDTSACKLKDIPIVQNFSDDDMLGLWYSVAAAFHPDPEARSPAPEPGYTLRITRSTDTTLQLRIWNAVNGSCSEDKAVYLKPACPGSFTGDYISTRGSTGVTQWTAVKILRHEEGQLLVYKCLREAFEGHCLSEGMRLDLLARSPGQAVTEASPLLASLQDVCLGQDNVRHLPSTDECDSFAKSAASGVISSSSCAVDNLPAVNFEPQQISGLWYEMVHSVDRDFPIQKALVHYQSLPNNQIGMSFTASLLKGQCMHPFHGVVRPRCSSQPGGEKLGRLKLPGQWSWAPWRVVHIDDSSVLIVLCNDEQPDGSCSKPGFKILALSKTPSPDNAERAKMHRILQQFVCLQDIQVEDTFHEGPSCKNMLDQLLLPASKTIHQ